MDQITDDTLNEIDDMIAREKLQAAMEYQSEAWADGVADGIEPEIIVDAAIAFALQETVRIYGEDGAEALLEQLKSRIVSGEFSPERSLQ